MPASKPSGVVDAFPLGTRAPDTHWYADRASFEQAIRAAWELGSTGVPIADVRLEVRDNGAWVVIEHDALAAKVVKR